MKKQWEDMLSNEDLEQLRGGFSEDLIVSENEENNEGNGGFMFHCDCEKEMIHEDGSLEVYPLSYSFGIEEFNMRKFGDESLINIWNNKKWGKFRGDTKLQDLYECSKCELEYK